MPKQYVNVKIPIELADEIDKVLEKKLLGYRSRAEFVGNPSETSLSKSKSHKVLLCKVTTNSRLSLNGLLSTFVAIVILTCIIKCYFVKR